MRAHAKAITVVVLSAILVSLWWWVLPPQMGGRTTFVVTQGASMEPNLREGDLAVLHEVRSYEEGDVVAFHSETLQAVVLHRVVSADADGRLTTRGDNNNFTDIDRPRQGEVIGKLDHVFEGAGNNVDWLGSQPVKIAGALLLGFAGFSIFLAWRERSDEGERAPDLGAALDGVVETTTVSAETTNESHVDRRPVLFVAGILALSVTGLCASFVAPPTAATNNGKTVQYSLRQHVDYSAKSRPGGELVYTDGVAKTGDPIFFSLVDEMTFAYKFDVESDADFEGEGTFSMDAVLRGESGWTHRMGLVAPTPVEGDTFEATAAVNVSQIREMNDRIQAMTGTEEGEYTLALEPVMNLDGDLAGSDFRQTMSTPVNFEVNRYMISPEKSSTEGGPQQASEAGTVSSAHEVSGEVPVSASSSALAKFRIPAIFGSLLAAAALWRLKRNDPEVEVDVHSEALHAFGSMFSHAAATAEQRFGVVGAPQPAPEPPTANANP